MLLPLRFGPSVFVLVDRDFAREKSRRTHGNIQVFDYLSDGPVYCHAC